MTAIYVGGMSVAQSFGVSRVLLPHYLIEGVTGEEVSRATGPFLQVAANGAALAMCVPLCLLLYRVSAARWKVVAVIGLSAALLGCFLTLTRSVWLGGLLSFAIVLVLDRQWRRWLLGALGAIGVAVGIGLALFPQLGSAVVDRLQTERSIDDRTTTNAAAISMLNAHPIAGVGWGRFLDLVDDYVRQQDLVPLTTTHILAHNVLLSRSSELGVVGGVLLMGALVLGPVAVSLRRGQSARSLPHAALLGMFLAWLSVAMLTPMGYPFSNYLLWTFTGVVAAWPDVHNLSTDVKQLRPQR
jgi:putative inorganic carbon (HCO3(-)) transporter